MSKFTHLSDYLSRNASDFSSQLAISTPERELTWSELAAEVQNLVDRLAPLLSHTQQEVVGLLMPNTWQHVVAYLALVDLGHIVLPVDVIFKPLEIKAVLDQIQPKFLIVDQANKKRVSSAEQRVIEFDELLTFEARDNPHTLRLPADKQIASLFFTSGTTGKPKASPYTHSNHLWNIEVCSRVWQWTHDDSLLLSLRLSHWYGTVMGLSGALYHGHPLYLRDRFDELETLELLASGKISMFTHGPLVYSRLLDCPRADSYDLSKVRLFISGSGPLPPAIWHRFKETFGTEILEVYGTTETGRIASNLLNERIPGSPGRILEGVKLKFDERGQVMVKSPGVFPGYFDNSQATNQKRTADGFWKTGDLGRLEGDRLILSGRVQEKIRRHGYTVSPRDVEWALHQDTRIKEVLVMGIQQPAQADDKLIYFIVGDINEAQVRSFCAEELPSVWRPDQIFMLGSLPRTRTGKPALASLRSMADA